MGLSTKITSFTWLAADTAGTNYDVNFGFTPEFAIVFSNSITVSTDTVGRSLHRTNIGFIKDGSNRASVCYGGADNSTGGAYASAHSTTAVFLSINTSTGAIDGGTLDVDTKANWPTDCIRFTVDGQGVADRRISVLAIGGTDITGVAIGSFTEPGATGTQNIAHGLGATPKGVLFFSADLSTAPQIGSSAGAMALSFGAFDGTNAWVSTWFGDDAASTMDIVSYAKTSDVIALGIDGTTMSGLASGSSLDATNIVINWSKRSSSRYCFYLAWVGGNFTVGSTTTATNTTPFSAATAGFISKAAMFVSACRAESTADTPTPHGQISIGAATSASERVAYAVLDEDGTANAEVTIALENDEVYANIDTSSAIQGLMDISDMTVDPMQLVMDDADPSGSFVGMAMWGSTSVNTSLTPDPGLLALIGQNVSLGFAINMPDEL
jgi:hypothetical protein